MLAADAGQDDFPEWLADFRGDAPGEEPLEPEAGPEEAGEESLPAEVEAAPGEPDSPAAEGPGEPDTADEPPAGAGDEAPGWLAEDEAPAWLADLDDVPAPEEEAEPEETPDWLVDLYADVPSGAEPPDLEEVPAPAAEAEEEEAPELEGEPEAGEELEAELEEAPEVEGEPEAEIEAGASAEEAEEAGAVPDWLGELEPEGMAEPPPAGSEPDFGDLTEAELDAAEVPDWLRELEPEGMAGSLVFEDEALAGAEEEVAIPEWVEAEEAPDWLAVLPAAEDEEEDWPLPEEEPAAVDLEDTEEPIPDWLTEAPEDEGEEDSDLAAELALAAAVPAWLADLPPDREDEPLPGEELLAEGDLPEWLVPDEAGPEDLSLERAEIPDWLMQLKPQEVRRAEGEDVGALATVEEAIEETGILAGIQGVLPIEMAIATPRVALPAGPVLTPAETAESRLFAEIVSRPAAVAAQAVERPPARLLDQVPRWIIYAVLIVVVALPLIFDTSLLTRTFPTAPEADAPYYAPVTGLQTAIDNLSAGAPVLVAFDYDPAASSEMDMVARPVLDHLMERQVPILALSLLPAGPPTAQKLLDDVAAAHSGYTYGQNYVNLGYYPGQAAAVRRLAQPEGLVAAQDFAGTPAGELPVLQGITDLAQVALVVELAPAQESVRWWIEQAGTPADVRLGAAVSASAEPLIRPYYETEPRQLEGIVGGVTGTALYEALRSDRASPGEATTARLNAQLLGTIVFALVLLGGNVVYFAQRGLGRER